LAHRVTPEKGVDIQFDIDTSAFRRIFMNSIIYIVGLVVVILFIAGFLGLR
jgi:hypothetical protein